MFKNIVLSSAKLFLHGIPGTLNSSINLLQLIINHITKVITQNTELCKHLKNRIFKICCSYCIVCLFYSFWHHQLFKELSRTFVESSSSSRSLTRPVQQQWCSWWSSSGPPSPHIISGEAELLKATVRFALVGVCNISEEHAWLSGPPHHRDTLGKDRCLVSCACVRRKANLLIFFRHFVELPAK